MRRQIVKRKVERRVIAKISAWESDAADTLPTPPGEAVFCDSFGGALGPDVRSEGTSLVFEKGVRGAAAEFDATQHVESSPTGFDADRPWTIGLWVKADGSLGCPLSLIEPAGFRRRIPRCSTGWP
jgi:hypothetical protein